MENEDILMRNQQLILENEALRLHIEDLKNGFEGSCVACEPVALKNRELLKERDEARRECRLLLLGQDVLRGVRDLPAPPDDLVTIVPVPRKEDGK